jgi:Fe-Mn family superoxide dismutase
MKHSLSQTKFGNYKANQTSYPFSLPDLPYDKKALEPHMSEETFNYHHGKHHNAYIQNLNKLIDNTDLASQDLENIILSSANDSSKIGIFNNAAQVWNHSFFWLCMKKEGGSSPQGTINTKITESFGSFDKFKQEFIQGGISQFGSGWVWLVLNKTTEKLEIIKTANAETPITKSLYPILCCDVWEHAYYIDYQNKRPDFLTIFLEKLVNWDFAQENFDHALSK